jgi:hypothetical protein
MHSNNVVNVSITGKIYNRDLIPTAMLMERPARSDQPTITLDE